MAKADLIKNGEIKKLARREALRVAVDVKNILKPYGKVKITGSIRRYKEFVGDIDIQGNSQEMLGEFLKLGKVIRGKPDGKKASIIYREVQLDLSIISDESWGAGLMTTTGNTSENIRLRKRASRLGLKLNQYGVWRGEENLTKGFTEKQIYDLLGAKYRKPSERTEKW